MFGAIVLLVGLTAQDPAALLDRGRALMERQQFAEAEAVFLELTGHEPDSSRGFYYLGVARLRRGDASRAIDALEQARALGSAPNPAVLSELSAAYLQTDELHQAARVLELALEVAPEEHRLRLQLGWIYYRLVEGERAETEFERVLSRAPNHAEAHFYMGMAKAALGKLEQAETSFRQALRWNPSLSEARLGLARVLSQSGKNNQAKTILRQVVEDTPTGAAAAHNELGLIAFREGGLKAAAEHYEAVVAASPSHRQATYNLWLVYQRLGDAERAKTAKARFLALERAEPSQMRSLSRTRARPPGSF